MSPTAASGNALWSSNVKIGIEASNFRKGGGRTHLVELLRHGDGNLGEIKQVVVWGSAETLAMLPKRSWLNRATKRCSMARWCAGRCGRPRGWSRLPAPSIWCSRPAGSRLALVRPRVVMSRNLLPFEAGERELYGHSGTRLRLELLRVGQARSFAGADGVIFLNQYALSQVTATMKRPPRRVAVIPHGVADRFRSSAPPRPARGRNVAGRAAESPLRVDDCSVQAPAGGHHAMRRLSPHIPVELTLVGSPTTPPTPPTCSGRRWRTAPQGRASGTSAQVGFEQLHHAYSAAEVFVFASSCENMPNILLEAMSNGLPIACARRGPMPEMLGEAGVYFDPEEPDAIAAAVRTLAEDPELRVRIATLAVERSRPFDWHRCACDTFAFLAEVAHAA